MNPLNMGHAQILSAYVNECLVGMVAACNSAMKRIGDGQKIPGTGGWLGCLNL